MDDLTLSTLQIVFQRLDHCQYFVLMLEVNCFLYAYRFLSYLIIVCVISGISYKLLWICLWEICKQFRANDGPFQLLCSRVLFCEAATGWCFCNIYRTFWDEVTETLLILVLSSGRQLSKCISLLVKKGFCSGQFVAFNYRFCQLSLLFVIQLKKKKILARAQLIYWVSYHLSIEVGSLQIIPCFLCTILILWCLNFW